MNKKLTISIISILVIIGVVFTIFMITSSQKSTDYVYMSDRTTAEKDGLVTKNVKIDNKNDDFKPKKGDFVKLVSKDDGKTFYKQEVVKHDDIPHGLMMKIHEMEM